MLALAIAAGIIPFDVPAESGEVSAPRERTAAAVRAQASTVIGNAIPQGAAIWTQPFDPADHAKYVMDWDVFLPEGVKIAEILSIRMSAAAAALGVGVDQTAPFSPIIDSTAGRKVRVFIGVLPENQEAPQFDASGTRLPVSCKIRTNEELPEEFERTWVLTVRQA